MDKEYPTTITILDCYDKPALDKGYIKIDKEVIPSDVIAILRQAMLDKYHG